MASLFLAGGAVRDMLLGRPVHDMDFAFSGTEEDFVQRFPHARKTSEHPPIWVAGGFEFCPLTGGSPDEDVMRRDLTVNALLLDDRGRLYMHPRSLDDLREGVLRLFRHAPFSTIPRACIVLPVWPRRCRTFPWRRRLWSRCAKQRRMACWNRFLRSGCAGKHSRRLPPRVLPVFFPRWNGADACVPGLPNWPGVRISRRGRVPGMTTPYLSIPGKSWIPLRGIPAARRKKRVGRVDGAVP